MLPEGSYELPRLPGKVHIEPQDRLKVAEELASRRICRWINYDEVHTVGGKKLLNGMFGVAKSAVIADQRPVLCVIMNQIPSNAVTHQLQGAVDKLPAITAWQSLVLEGDEKLATGKAICPVRFTCLRFPRFGASCGTGCYCIGLPEFEKVVLCSNVVPMGWASSVGLMQEMAESSVYRRGLSQKHQVRKGSPLPSWMSHTLKTAEEMDRMWWHVYLDNFCAGERLLPSDPKKQGQECHRLAEMAWTNAGVLSSEKKKKEAVLLAAELGAELDGELKTMGASCTRLLKTLQFTLHLLSKPFLKRKELQILLGRWVFILQFRRPEMSILQDGWTMISGKMKQKKASVVSCRTECFPPYSIQIWAQLFLKLLWRPLLQIRGAHAPLVRILLNLAAISSVPCQFKRKTLWATLFYWHPCSMELAVAFDVMILQV